MNIREIEQKLSGHEPELMGVRGHYAVLVPLVEKEGSVHVLLEVRSDTLGRQPGEVCFPGGKMEPGEGVTQCAFRETWEELGIPPSAIRPIARLDLLHHQNGNLMFPLLAQLDPDCLTSLRPNLDEVKEAFLVPLDFLRENSPQVYTYALQPDVGEDFPYERIGFPNGYAWAPGKVEVPIWNYKNHAIWGMTARILLWLLSWLRD
ncbi:MAG: CoA pyrophosphatase [Intestinimonas sp.]|nr:CoA pyrophosphatase [Intestinimonas sp.]